MKKFWIVLLILIGVSFYIWNFISSRPGEQKVTYEPSIKECFSVENESTRYCVHKAKQGNNGGIVYHLHGRNLDEHTWNDDTFYTSLIQNYWATSNRIPPIVVTVSYGPIWLLTKKGSLEKSGLLDRFILGTIPKIEAQLAMTPTYRAVMGESMGGLNSLIAGLSYPLVFNRVAALCPSVYRVSPFDSFRTIWNEIKVTGAEIRVIGGLILLAREYVSNVSEWEAIRPLTLIKNLDSQAKIDIYLSAPLYDRYGLFSGASDMADIAKSRGLSLKWHPLYGGHCAVDINSIGEFLL
jgi:hypothetical protein